ncbi:hypothetical protein NEHOM01_2020 [Nematocida homosporus]|uniref:uncharacterized protein n=1 Tax=Nematocida homosporus TaxID=1912981 RepID=UPI00221FF84E|nr:uncharacterized protein NEHOM01_2020 [Nematocida homosporus]KAI5187222.1 hypothetical protein NEHOM01_2020 [Nematocida homosporus]
MQMRTFGKRGRPSRKSLGVLAAPSLFALEVSTERPIKENSKSSNSRRRSVGWEGNEDSGKVEIKRFKDLPIAYLEKLGESTFSEIFIDRRDMRVYKIMPITFKKEYKRVQHTKMEYFLKECLVMGRMNKSVYSTKMFSWMVVVDRYPEELVEKCRIWAADNWESAENLVPQKNNSSGIFGIIQMEYGGIELSKIDWGSIRFEQVQEIISKLRLCVDRMGSLGVEHRDMHESNVLVEFLGDSGCRVRAIDYSLAWADWVGVGLFSIEVVDDLEAGVIYYRAGRTLYTDLDTEMPWLFANYDDDPHRQVYKRMNAEYSGENRWQHRGHSNRYWLQYLIDWIYDKWRKTTQI